MAFAHRPLNSGSAFISAPPQYVDAPPVEASAFAHRPLKSGTAFVSAPLRFDGASSGIATLTGVSASSFVGSIQAKGEASAQIVGVSAVALVGSISASGEASPDASITLPGVTASASVGIITAFGERSGISINITEDKICAVVRAYILSIAGDMRVIRTPVNLASMPDGPYVSFTPMPRHALSTDVSTYQGNTRLVQRSDQMTFQVDCFGDGAADLAETINILFRDQYAVDHFAESELPVAPLYANDVMQMPFVNDANQYEERYTQEIVLQFNPLVSLTQQSANILNVAIINAGRV